LRCAYASVDADVALEPKFGVVDMTKEKTNCCVLLSVILVACATSPAPSNTTLGAISENESSSKAASDAKTESESPSLLAPNIKIPNAKRPLDGVLTGGAPSADNLKEAKAQGYRTIVSLLPVEESKVEGEQAALVGIRFVSIPIASAADLTEQNARRLGEIIDDSGNRPLILHCASGNRAGALLALYAFYVQHRSVDEALDLGVHAGLTKLRDDVERILGANEH